MDTLTRPKDLFNYFQYSIIANVIVALGFKVIINAYIKADGIVKWIDNGIESIDSLPNPGTKTIIIISGVVLIAIGIFLHYKNFIYGNHILFQVFRKKRQSFFIKYLILPNIQKVWVVITIVWAFISVVLLSVLLKNDFLSISSNQTKTSTTEQITDNEIYVINIDHTSPCQLLKNKVLSTELKPILFSLNSADIFTLNPDEQKNVERLNKWMNYINMHPNTQFNIVGHASSEGSFDLNYKLSKERAQAVKNHLNKKIKTDDKMLRVIPCSYLGVVGTDVATNNKKVSLSTVE